MDEEAVLDAVTSSSPALPRGVAEEERVSIAVLVYALKKVDRAEFEVWGSWEVPRVRVEMAEPEGVEEEVRVGKAVLVVEGLAVEVGETMGVAVRLGSRGEEVRETRGD